MAEIKRIYRQKLPEMKLVGRRYGEGDKENGFFSNKWEEWFKNDLFSPLMLDAGKDEPFEDCNAYIGFSRCPENEPFEYWIGVFMPKNAKVPEGYESMELEAGEAAVLWVYGKEPDIYEFCCLERLGAEGMEWKKDASGVRRCFERYVCPRFTEPDESGNRILDMCFYI